MEHSNSGWDRGGPRLCLIALLCSSLSDTQGSPGSLRWNKTFKFPCDSSELTHSFEDINPMWKLIEKWFNILFEWYKSFKQTKTMRRIFSSSPEHTLLWVSALSPSPRPPSPSSSHLPMVLPEPFPSSHPLPTCRLLNSAPGCDPPPLSDHYSTSSLSDLSVSPSVTFHPV